MATRQKTIEYCFPTSTGNLTAGTRLDFSAITLQLPEVGSRVIQNVTLEIRADNSDATAVSLTSWLIGIKLAAVAFDDVTVTDTIGNSGDPQTFFFTRDVTSYFTTNFGSLPEQTCQVGVQFGAVAVNNVQAKLIITYDFSGTDLVDSGTATSGGASTLTNTGKSYTTDVHKHNYIKITGGTGSGQIRKIASNTGTVITVATAWSTQPDNTSTYQIRLAHMKTVRIPIESLTTTLTNSLAEIGTNQVPDLDDFLPEANKDYKDIFFEVFGNDSNTGTTDLKLCLALDAESEAQSGAYEQALDGAVFRFFRWQRLDMDPTTAHAFKARCDTTGKFSCLGAVLVVTYSYYEPDTTVVMNSLCVPFGVVPGLLGSSTSNDRHRLQRELNIQEPATITMVQSGFVCHFMHTSNVTVNALAGAQSSFRAYSAVTGGVQVGPASFVHRIDSGAAQGEAYTLARGIGNVLRFDAYASALDPGGFSALLLLNYTSGKSALTDGSERHNKSCHKLIKATAADFNRTTQAAIAPSVPEITANTGHWWQGTGYMWALSALHATECYTLDVEQGSGAGIEDGWINIATAFIFSDGERATHFMYAAFENFYDYAGSPAGSGGAYKDPGKSMSPTGTRRYKTDTTAAAYPSINMWYTYHTITKTISGTVNGYAGDGSAIPVRVHNAANQKLLLNDTTVAGGAWSAVWYDDVAELYTHAQEDATHVGRSEELAP